MHSHQLMWTHCIAPSSSNLSGFSGFIFSLVSTLLFYSLFYGSVHVFIATSSPLLVISPTTSTPTIHPLSVMITYICTCTFSFECKSYKLTYLQHIFMSCLPTCYLNNVSFQCCKSFIIITIIHGYTEL